MATIHRVESFSWVILLGVFSSACSGTEVDRVNAIGGTTSTVTAVSTTAPNGGLGGAPLISGATGGTPIVNGTTVISSPSNGGNTASTATESTGGTSSNGGKSATGGTSTGGASSNGGKSATGGTSSNGGKSATGGDTSSNGGTAGAPYRGVANSPCNARTNLKVSWYYNWMQTANEPCGSTDLGGQFVPMIWGKSGEHTTSAITNAVNTFVSRGNQFVLGFNEPDNTTQANISVATAIALWPGFNNTSIKIGSPATQANTSGVTWFKDFNTQLNANSALRADFIAIHWYGWNAGSCDAQAVTLENYIKQIEALPGNRPIWLTEWGCLNGSDNGSSTTTQAHITGAVAMFAKHPRIARYAWYPWATEAHKLNNTDGSLTSLGTFYASLPAYK